jgi:hypothetical protein
MKRMLLALALVTLPAWAHHKRHAVKEGAATGGHAVRDGARTFGRSTKALFKHGPHAAKETWRENARHTAAHARHHARTTRHDARR